MDHVLLNGEPPRISTAPDYSEVHIEEVSIDLNLSGVGWHALRHFRMDSNQWLGVNLFRFNTSRPKELARVTSLGHMVPRTPPWEDDMDLPCPFGFPLP